MNVLYHTNLGVPDLEHIVEKDCIDREYLKYRRMRESKDVFIAL